MIQSLVFSFLASSAAAVAVATAGDTTVYRSAKVLVTGFEPFGGYDYNPSGDVAQEISGTCMNFTFAHNRDRSSKDGSTITENIYTCFDGVVLPVDSVGSSTVANTLYSGDPFPYDAILHLGLEDVAKGLKLETFAMNQLAEPDGSEPLSICLNNSNFDQPTAAAAVPGAQCELPTTANLGRLTLEEALTFAAPTAMAAKSGKKSDMLDVCLREAWSRNAGMTD